MSLKEEMPLLARNEGVWDGFYRYFDSAGNKIDEHKSRLICRMLGEDGYHQTNHYFWEDGKKEIRDFPANVKDKRLWFYDKIDGWAAEVPLDANSRTMMLYWTRLNEPGIYIYEMIQLSDCGQYRARVWQWFLDGRLFQRTLVDEQRRSHEWESYDNEAAVYTEVANF